MASSQGLPELSCALKTYNTGNGCSGGGFVYHANDPQIRV
jgi:hypothetical protein